MCYTEFMTNCKIENCTRESQFKAKNLCGVHYHRIRAHGDPHVTLRTPTGTPLSDRVLPEEKWLEVDRGYETPCREWQGNINSTGYGVIKFNNRSLKLHRVMYQMFKGEIPEGHVVMHLCDNPPCANPDHLRSGTSQENTQDAVRKGRNRSHRGLRADQVHEIRLRWRLGETQQALESEFGVGGGTVSRIMAGVHYKNIPDLSSDVPVNQEARVRSLSPERLKDLEICVGLGLTRLEIQERIGVYSNTVSKYFPGYREREWFLQNMPRAGETVECDVCGRVALLQNLTRHKKSDFCRSKAELARSTRLEV